MTGAVELACERDGARTIVRTARAEGLARVSRLPSHDGAAHLQLATLGPGMLAGDAFALAGSLGPEATLVVNAQMATPIFAGAGATVATTSWRVAEGATLCAIGQPLVPAAASTSTLRTEIDVCADGCAIVAETLVVTADAALRSTVVARIDDVLALRDAVALPAVGVRGEAVGTVFAIARDAALRARFQATACRLLDTDATIHGGVGGTELALVVRTSGPTYAVQQATTALARVLLEQRAR